LLQITSESINYRSLLKTFQILIDNSQKHVHAVIFKSMPAYLPDPVSDKAAI